MKERGMWRVKERVKCLVKEMVILVEEGNFI